MGLNPYKCTLYIGKMAFNVAYFQATPILNLIRTFLLSTVHFLGFM
jgi:hypothetical protein